MTDLSTATAIATHVATVSGIATPVVSQIGEGRFHLAADGQDVLDEQHRDSIHYHFGYAGAEMVESGVSDGVGHVDFTIG